MLIFSFGIKFRKPQEVLRAQGLTMQDALVLNGTYLANPHNHPDLRDKTGFDPEVIEFLTSQANTKTYLDRYVVKACSYPRKALGVFCVGGRHRSVYLANEIATRLLRIGQSDITVKHIELGVENVLVRQ